MTDIQQFISMAAGKLGVPESGTKSATAGMLSFVQKKADAGDFSQLLGKVSGLGDLLKEAPSAKPASGGGGMLGGLMGKASSAFGGGGGSALDLLALFQNSGLGTGKAQPLATMLLEFLKSKAGPDLTNRILEKVPEVQKFLG